MRKSLFCSSAVLAISLAVTGQSGYAQETQSARSTIAQSLKPPALSQARVDSGLIEFPLPKDAQAYGAIDGRKMHRYVEELAQISRRYRDNGHPQFWGRIIGTSSDTETNEWLAGKFKALGLSDVRIQPLDLPPQWIPQSWDVTMTAGGNIDETELGAAGILCERPAQGRRGAGRRVCRSRHGGGLRGQGRPGKAVFIYSMQGLRDQGGGQAGG